jgi:hypothetical protein
MAMKIRSALLLLAAPLMISCYTHVPPTLVAWSEFQPTEPAIGRHLELDHRLTISQNSTAD